MPPLNDAPQLLKPREVNSILRVTGSAWLRLLPPRLRYVEAPTGGNAATTDRLWRSDGATTCWFEDGFVRLGARLEPVPGLAQGGGGQLCLAMTALRPVQVSFCAVEFTLPCAAQPWFLDRFLRWGMLRGTASLNEFSACLLWLPGQHGGIEVRNAHGFFAYRARWLGTEVRLRVVLDAAALHPRWRLSPSGPRSTAAPSWSAGQTLAVRLRIAELPREEPAVPVVPARWPAGAEACLTLTDHCDFDTAETLSAFLRGDGRNPGWLGRGLRLTKGVFALKTPPPGLPGAASLKDADYRRLIETLRDDGSEVAPHGLNESGNIDPGAFRQCLEEYVAVWRPGTWIDHGTTLDYCYAMGGADNPSYALLDTLARHGFRTLWAYQDAPLNASQSLNMLAGRAPALRAWLPAVLRHLGRRRWLVALHYLRSAVHWHVRGVAGVLLTTFLSACRSLFMVVTSRQQPRGKEVVRIVRRVQRALAGLRHRRSSGGVEPYTRADLIELSAAVYPERAVPLNQCGEHEPVLFATMETLHLRDIYTRDALGRLAAERGLHIGHCYLLNRLRYIHGLFEPGAGPLRLAYEWVEFLDALSSQVRAGVIWNPTMTDLADWMRWAGQITCVPSGESSLELRNPGSRAVDNFTLLFPRAVAVETIRWADRGVGGWRLWPDWLAVWGSVPAAAAITVQWSRATEVPASSTAPGSNVVTTVR